MLVVGLTGGIGSGKTTVANLFADLGTPVIDADVIAKQVTAPDQPAFMDIIDHFEEELLQSDGTINRAKLRQIIFEHPEERRWLEELLHPIILKKMAEQTKKLNTAYCIAVIPLLFESGPHTFIDRILLVDTPEHLQIERVVLRDNENHQQIKSIIEAQISRKKRLEQADDVIVNDSVKDHLISQVESLHLLYTRLGSSPQ